MRAVARVLACWAVAAVVASAWASPRIGAGGRTTSGAGHAWLVVPADEGAMVLHAPPRLPTGAPSSGARAGTLRTVRRVKEIPEAIGAVGDRLYLVFAAESERRVLSLRAEASGIEGLWAYEPAGRMDPHPRLAGGGRLAGLSAIDGALHALIERDDGAELHRLGDRGWEPVALPAFGAGVRLVGLGVDGRMLVVTTGPDDATAAWLRGDDGTWERSGIAVGDAALASAALICPEPGVVVLVDRTGAGLGLWTLVEDGLYELATVPGAPDSCAVAPMAGNGGRVLVFWETPGRTQRGGAVRLVELSASTGEVLFDGEPTRVMPIAAEHVRLLALVLVAAMAMVIFLAVRPDPSGSGIVLPEGTALAEPSRRLVGSMADGVIAALLVGSIMGVRVSEIVTLMVLVRPDNAWLAAPSTLAVGMAIGTLSEWLTGRSPGKLLVGCRVVGGLGGAERAALWRHLVRNAVKWLLPPVAMMALVDPEARHRGDTLARLVVVVPTGDGDRSGA